MTEDQMMRGAITAVSVPIIALLIQKAKAHLSAARNKEWRGLLERLFYRLGVLASTAYRASKKTLNRA